MSKRITFERQSGELCIQPESRRDAWDLYYCVPSYDTKMFREKRPLIIPHAQVIRVERSNGGAIRRVYENSSGRVGEIRMDWAATSDFLESFQKKLTVRSNSATALDILRYLPLSCLVWYLVFLGGYLFALESNGPRDFSQLYTYNISSAQQFLFFFVILSGSIYPGLHYLIFRKWVRSEKHLMTLRVECLSLWMVSLPLALLTWEGSGSFQETLIALKYYLRAMVNLD